ncbi:MAG: hypothetical protein ABIQ51_10995 [Mesorhizobium sp.]
MAKPPESIADANRRGRKSLGHHRPADAAKALVMTAIGQMVDDGAAEWSLAATGEIELRLATGEVFLLGDQEITRLA